MDFQRELESLINKCSIENGSNTPDFILAQYLGGCLRAFEVATREREIWYGRGMKIVPPSTKNPTDGQESLWAVPEKEGAKDESHSPAHRLGAERELKDLHATKSTAQPSGASLRCLRCGEKTEVVFKFAAESSAREVAERCAEIAASTRNETWGLLGQGCLIEERIRAYAASLTAAKQEARNDEG